VSCTKAQKFFEENKIEVAETADARKQKIDNDHAWELICSQAQVFIGKGKKVLEFEPGEENREEILKAAMGRSGNLRAPTLKTGDRVFIGFNEDIYKNL
jgi:arsenate reductase-like glutaredoxin family protein